MGKGDKTSSKPSASKNLLARYFFRQSTINDRHASDGIANQLEEGNRFKKLLKSLQLRRMTRAEKMERLKKATAAHLTTTSEPTPTSSGPQPTTAASLSAPAAGSHSIASVNASTSGGGPQPTTSDVKDFKIVTFATKLVSSTPPSTVGTSASSRRNMKRVKKVLSKGARRKLRQQQIEVQRSSSGEDTDTEGQAGARNERQGHNCVLLKKRKRPQRKRSSSVVPLPSTSATVQQQVLPSSSAPAQSGRKNNDDLPLVKFVGLPPKKSVPKAVTDSDSTEYEGP